MNFEEMQQAWQNMKYVPKTEKELRAIMYRKSAPRFRPRKREIRRFANWMTVLIGCGIACYYFKDPSTGIATLWVALAAIDRFFGIQYMSFSSQYERMEESFTEFVQRTKRISITLVLVYGLLFIGAVTAILNMHRSIQATAFWLAVFVCAFAAAVWSSVKRWWNSVSDAKERVDNFKSEDDETR